MKTVKIQFTETYTVKAVDGATYKKGSVYDLPEASAAHFINRGRAIAVANPQPESKTEIQPPAPKAPQPEEHPPTADVNLHSLFEKQRQQDLSPEVIPDTPPTKRTRRR